jgi:hypothetical protein
MDESDQDIELLVLYLERSIVTSQLPGKETVISFNFTDMKKFGRWWIVVTDKDIDVCVRDPGKENANYF